MSIGYLFTLMSRTRMDRANAFEAMGADKSKAEPQRPASTAAPADKPRVASPDKPARGRPPR